MKNTGSKQKGAKGSRKKKSISLAATEAAAIRNKYLRAFGETPPPEETSAPSDEEAVEEATTTEKPKTDSVNMSQLQALDMPELNKMAKKQGIPNYGSLQKHELIFQLLQRNAEQAGVLYTEGCLEILPEGFGFLRSESSTTCPARRMFTFRRHRYAGSTCRQATSSPAKSGGRRTGNVSLPSSR